MRSQLEKTMGRSLKTESGLTLLETLIAAFILLFIVLSMVSAYNFGRLNLDREEVKRKATALAMDRLDTIKSRYAREVNDNNVLAWSNISPGVIDTTYTVDGTTFTLTSAVTTEIANDPPASRWKKIVATVSWTARKNDNTAVTRNIAAATTVCRIVGGT
jgi:Tfp pilus assembly protein PilV